MELIYLWVGKYKNIEDIGVVLNSNYEEEEKVQFSESLLKLRLKKKENSINIFRNNVITIIGKNGSGKSNFVNALSLIIRSMNGKNPDYEDYDNNEPPEQFCLIFRQLNQIFYYSKGVDNIECYVDDVLINKLKILNTKVAKFVPFLRFDDSKFLEQPDKVLEILCKKINNYFYYDRFRSDETKATLAELLRQKDLKLFRDNPNLLFEKSGYEFNITDEIPRINSLFINARNKLAKVYPIKTSAGSSPVGLTYKTRAILKKYKMKRDGYNTNIKDFLRMDLPIICFTKILTNLMELILHLPEEDFLTNKVLKYLKEYPYGEPYSLRGSRLKFYNDIQAGIVDLLMNLRDSKKKYFYPNFVAVNAAILQVLIDNTIDFERGLSQQVDAFKKFELIISNKNAVIRQVSDSMIPIRKNCLNYFNKETEYLYEFLFDLNFYKQSDSGVYTFNELSTGEQRILKFLSDVYILANNYIKTEDNNDMLIDTYIFDEMDLSWHPEWQRKMVYYILDILKDKNIIYTTHSPIILSDMPRKNVILLEKNKNGITYLKEGFSETFGANIHDLYNNEFFFDCEGSCTMGEFAKTFIEEILSCLKSENRLNHTRYKKIKQKIELIGEPIIKNHLLEMLYAREDSETIKPSIESLMAQNRLLKERLEKLENEKNNSK